MNKFLFALVILLFAIISCQKTGVKSWCYINCMKKIKRTSMKAQTCIVSNTLINTAKSNPLSVAKTIVKTVKGAKVAFEECEQYINAINSARSKLSRQCSNKCRSRNQKN